MKVKSLSSTRLFETPWTAVHSAYKGAAFPKVHLSQYLEPEKHPHQEKEVINGGFPGARELCLTHPGAEPSSEQCNRGSVIMSKALAEVKHIRV